MTRPLVLALALLAAPAARAAAPGDAEPLTLERAVETALAHQPQLLSARAQVRAAAARVTQADAALLPQGTATAGVVRAEAPTLGGPASTGDTWSLSISGSQILFDANAWYVNRSSRAASAAQQEGERATLQSVVQAVRTAWYQAASARDLVDVARETLANREAHLAQVKGFVQVGTRPEIDLAQARADRANAKVGLISAENDLAIAHAQLNQAMGVAASTDYPLAPTEVTPLPGEDGTIEVLLAEALAHRPDVAARARSHEAQEASLKAAKGTFLPTAAATGRIGESGPEVDATRRNWTLGLTLTWPFLEGGRGLGRVREQQALLEALDADDEGFRQEVRFEVEQARLQVRAAAAALEASGEVVQSAREQLRLAEARYKAGLGSGLEASDAQVTMANAQALEVKARFSLASARSQLARALGRG
jgi:outer membrane protein